MSAEKVVADIGPQIAAMDKLIAQCEERYGSRTKVLDHPVLGPLTASQWRKFHWSTDAITSSRFCNDDRPQPHS